MKKDQTRILLRAEVKKDQMLAPTWGILPILRYVPSRQMMQRMIRRACYLPASFIELEWKSRDITKQASMYIFTNIEINYTAMIKDSLERRDRKR